MILNGKYSVTYAMVMYGYGFDNVVVMPGYYYTTGDGNGDNGKWSFYIFVFSTNLSSFKRHVYK